jgi:hypothetical protein
MVLLAVLVATAANYRSLKAYFAWNFQNSGCEQKLAERGLDRVAESALKDFAREALEGVEDNDVWDESVKAEGRTLNYTYRLKRPVVDLGGFQFGMSKMQKDFLESHCSDDGWFLRSIKATETHTFYSFEGAWLTSFSIGPADCPRDGSQ